ncbi:MAG: YlmC/YmxH family sporulation protein [Firmicutes bacterium]|nr:YlmC/YmxH family sporulation protein [Bacillota bacterium]MBO2520713.1 YlmC/YmxH family sporulation protein [Bacillota bacterium]
MRYSDLAGKEIIDIDEGARVGVISESDLVIDCERGKVHSVIIPTRGRFWGRRELVIPWSGIKKIGVDLIIVSMGRAGTSGRGYWDPE